MRRMVLNNPPVTGLRSHEFWALKDVSFELKRGETLGVVGVNGSGKSTLLRVINGIYPPDSGAIEIRGRLGSLIALGAGFHPHMTGRENIMLNGLILGMSKAELEERTPEIIAFADIGPFLDSPVATYSSGMTVRLGFAIAIHTKPEIMIVDEILAVGDVKFQKKCLDRILTMRSSGLSTLLVSHSLATLERLCDNGLVLDHGNQRFYGPIREAVKAYIDVVDEDTRYQMVSNAPDRGIGNASFENARVYQLSGNPDSPEVEVGKDIAIEFDYSFKFKEGPFYQIRVTILTAEGREVQKFVYQECPYPDGLKYKNENFIQFQQKGRLRLVVRSPKLFPQVFRIDLAACKVATDYHEGTQANATAFRVVEPQSADRYFEYGNMTITDFEHEMESL